MNRFVGLGAAKSMALLEQSGDYPETGLSDTIRKVEAETRPALPEVIRESFPVARGEVAGI